MEVSTVVVGAVCLCMVTGAVGYRVGALAERGRAATAAESAVATARVDAAREAKRRGAAAVRNARAGAAAREAQLNAQLEALRRAPRPGCEWGADRLRGVSAAVDAANATPE